MSETTFKDENLAMQHLARELVLIRKHNKSFKEGDPQDTLMLHAEAGLVCTALEHFVRMLLGADALDNDTLPHLLEKAVSRKLVELPFNHQQCGIRQVVRIRNTLLHGNFAQAARQAKKASVADYFKTVFATDLEGMFKVSDFVMAQVNHNTGKRFAPLVEVVVNKAPCGFEGCPFLMPASL
jgi:hypothetical protein